MGKPIPLAKLYPCIVSHVKSKPIHTLGIVWLQFMYAKPCTGNSLAMILCTKPHPGYSLAMICVGKSIPEVTCGIGMVWLLQRQLFMGSLNLVVSVSVILLNSLLSMFVKLVWVVLFKTCFEVIR